MFHPKTGVVTCRGTVGVPALKGSMVKPGVDPGYPARLIPAPPRRCTDMQGRKQRERSRGQRVRHLAKPLGSAIVPWF